MSRVGIIEPLGIRYGLTMNAWISSASATAMATVMTSSISDFIADPDPSRSSSAYLLLQEADSIRRPVREERLADDPGSRNRPPEATVLRVGAVVAHHVVVAPGNGDGLGEVARAA